MKERYAFLRAARRPALSPVAFHYGVCLLLLHAEQVRHGVMLRQCLLAPGLFFELDQCVCRKKVKADQVDILPLPFLSRPRCRRATLLAGKARDRCATSTCDAFGGARCRRVRHILSTLPQMPFTPALHASIAISRHAVVFTAVAAGAVPSSTARVIAAAARDARTRFRRSRPRESAMSR